MQEDNSIMKYESVLPSNFDGSFRFSNPSDEDFVGIWGGVQYLFPAGTTVPIVMHNQTPLEVQHIRKKFAKDLAEREWFKSKGYKTLSNQEGKVGNRTFSSFHQAAAYTVKDLEPYIRDCLTLLPESKLTSRTVETVSVEDKIHRKEDGSFTTEAIDSKTSLRAKALNS